MEITVEQAQEIINEAGAQAMKDGDYKTVKSLCAIGKRIQKEIEAEYYLHSYMVVDGDLLETSVNCIYAKVLCVLAV